MAADGKEYSLGPLSRILIQRGDLTKMDVDAIVNAANERMLGGGGVDGAIHRAAGPRLYHACKAVPEVEPGVRCPTGEARITPGFNLKARHVIHTVGPVYDSPSVSAPLLESAYKSSLNVANEHKLKSVAFAAISTGVYGYPYEEAAEVSLKAVKEAIGEVQDVYFVIFQADLYDVYTEVADGMFSTQQAAAPQSPPPAPQSPPLSAAAATGEGEVGEGGASQRELRDDAAQPMQADKQQQATPAATTAAEGASSAGPGEENRGDDAGVLAAAGEGAAASEPGAGDGDGVVGAEEGDAAPAVGMASGEADDSSTPQTGTKRQRPDEL